jgi:GNAT superfamily N-acetyltransferase
VSTDGRTASDLARVALRDPAPGDETAWRALWSAYNDFYEAKVPEPVTAATWRRMLDPAVPILGRLAERNGVACGFSICVLHEGTWTTGPVCYLEDLFVDPSVRGGGIGRALMQDVLDRARDKGWSRLYWHTRADNVAARRLYDRFVSADDFVRYRMILR